MTTKSSSAFVKMKVKVQATVALVIALFLTVVLFLSFEVLGLRRIPNCTPILRVLAFIILPLPIIALFDLPYLYKLRKTVLPSGYNLRAFGYGWFFSMAVIGLAFHALVRTDWLQVITWAWLTTPIESWIVVLSSYLLVALYAAWWEELIFRANLLNLIRKLIDNQLASNATLAATFAALVSGVIFAYLHLRLNPELANATDFTKLRLYVGGIVFGLVYVGTESLWASVGFHAAWNFFETYFFNFLANPETVGALTELTGPEWLVGIPAPISGDGLIQTIMLIAIGVSLLIAIRVFEQKNSTSEVTS